MAPTTTERRLRARRTRFDLGDTPLHWIPGDPQSSHTVNVVHIVLPPGERWFCDVFRDALPLVTDPQLRDDVRGFIAQEATHAKAHDLGLDYLAARGIDVRVRVAAVDRSRKALRRRLHRLPMPVYRQVLLTELAAIASIEHVTSTMGNWMVEHDGFDRAGADEAMVGLLRWHAAEEVEHRSVAFDLYQHLHGGYPRRAVTMGLAGVGLSAGFVVLARRLLAADPTADVVWSWRQHLEAASAGRTLSLVKMWQLLPQYLVPGHHPSKAGSDEAAIAYLASAPGVVRERKVG